MTRTSIAILLLLICLNAGAGQADTPDGVLIIHSNQRPLPAAIIIDDTLRSVLSEGNAHPIEVFSEFLDAERFAAPDVAAAQAELLHRKYTDRNIRVIVAVVPQALQFVLDHRDQILPGVPVVHISLPTDSLPPGGLPSGFVGATVDLDPSNTFALALRLQPDARHVVIVVGASERDRVWEKRIKGAVARLPGNLDVRYLTGLPSADLFQQLRALSRDTIVYTPGYFDDGSGRVITPRQSAALIAAASAAPVYGPYDTFMDTGVVGGAISPYADQAKQAGAFVKQLLKGAVPTAIATPPLPTVPIVDWRQINRWGFEPNLLPANTVVRFREPTAWDEYWRPISLGIAVVALQFVLIAALLFERRRRHNTATALEDVQARMRLAAHAANLSMWMWDITRDKIWATPPRRQVGRGDSDAIAFSDVLDAVHPADRDELDGAVRKVLSSGEELDVQYRILEPGGNIRWISARGRAEKGENPRLLGVALDITERKRSELQAEQDRSALRHVSRVSMLGPLSAAIAHQLNQPLAAILGNAEAAQKMLNREPLDVVELREICNDIVAEDHRAAEVIRRLGDLYKRGDKKRESLDLNQLIRDTVDLVRAELMARHVTPAIIPAPALPMINGGYVQLQQVLLNLVLNASDAMKDVDVASRTLRIWTNVVGDDVQMCVADNGPGVPTDHLTKIFDAFWTTKQSGLGIGLAICHSIVDSHGGAITVFNNPEGGATFCVRLPTGRPT